MLVEHWLEAGKGKAKDPVLTGTAQMLVPSGWNDRISSVRVGGNVVLIAYENANFEGASITIGGGGSHANFAAVDDGLRRAREHDPLRALLFRLATGEQGGEYPAEELQTCGSGLEGLSQSAAATGPGGARDSAGRTGAVDHRALRDVFRGVVFEHAAAHKSIFRELGSCCEVYPVQPAITRAEIAFTPNDYRVTGRGEDALITHRQAHAHVPHLLKLFRFAHCY